MDIIERLNDPETCIDAIDDAISEIERLRKILHAELPTQQWNYVMESLATLYEVYCRSDGYEDLMHEINHLMEAYDKWLG
jgi:hypothetical protein